jgi:Tol biopolymer transport system component
LDGTNVKTLAPKGVGPAFSPDGKRIAFTSENGDAATLFVMDADGSHVTKVNQAADSICIGAVWTPDGKHLLYTQVVKDSGERPEVAIWLTNIDGTGGKAVTKSDSLLGPATSMIFVMRAAGQK